MSVPLRRNRDFMLVWAGQGLSELGSQISTVAYPLLVLALTGSPAKAGVVGLAASLPLPLLALPAGLLADRLDRKRLMVSCDAIRAAGLTGLSIAVLSGHVAFAVAIAVAFLDGALMTVSYVTERGVLQRLVAPDQLSAAVARSESSFYASSIVGPPIGGVLFALSRAAPFLADAVSYAFSSTAALLTRATFQEERAMPRRGFIVELTSGFGWLWRQPLLRGAALVAAASNPTYRALYLLLVVLARRHGASSSLIGVMFGLVAAGGLGGGLLASARLARVPVRVAVLADAWTTALLAPLLLIAQGTLFTAVLIALIELPAPLVNSSVQGLRGALAPDQLQGRVVAAAGMTSQSLGWLGPLAIGLALAHLSDSASILVLVGWSAAVAVTATLSRGMRTPVVEPTDCY